MDVSQGEDYFTKRLFPCWILLSTDPFPEGTSGQVLNDSANMAVARVKMSKDKRRTVWELPTNSVGRYVRVMLEGKIFLCSWTVVVVARNVAHTLFCFFGARRV